MLVFESKDFTVDFNNGAGFTCDFQESGDMVVDFGPTISTEYHGAYELTPTTDFQYLPTTNKVLTREIIIDPIPANYGLITYNGNIITVS